jgi:undecaprenyl-diphosphatase
MDEHKTASRTRRRWAIAGFASLGVFAFLWVLVACGAQSGIDQAGYVLFVQTLRCGPLTSFSLAVSSLIAFPVIVLVVAVVFATTPGWRIGVFYGLTVLATYLLNGVVKAVVMRPRPVGYRLAEEASSSFPSAHAMMAVVVFGLIVWMVWRLSKSRAKRAVFAAAFVVLIVCIGASRIYLGVHYTSDVLAGYAFGLAVLSFACGWVAPRVFDR